MATENKPGLQSAGSIDIQSLVIVGATGAVLDIRDYLVELNIFEDIFSNAIYGNIQLSDSRNLIKEIPIIGDELLVVKAITPSFPVGINKTFRIYSVTDRNVVRDQNTQIYTLHFCSQEVIKDVIQPLYRSFSGSIETLVSSIYKQYLETDRTYTYTNGKLSENKKTTELRQLTPIENAVKFVSPGWSPFQCINWLMSKSIPSKGKACSFMCWETSQAFYFGNIETIFTVNNTAGVGSLGTYTYSAKNTTGGTTTVESKMFLIESMDTIKTTDHLENYFSGYLASKLVTLDVINKKYDLVEYDHVGSFAKYDHTSGKDGIPLFVQNSPRSAGSNVSFYPINPGLHSIKNNVSERMPDIHGNRISNLMELNNFKLDITVPGRTDAEVGSMLYLSYPDVSPTDPSDKTKSNDDTFYSGHYLVTALRHKINPLRHTMTLEIVKDSLTNKVKK